MNKGKFILFFILTFLFLLFHNLYSQITLEWSRYHNNDLGSNEEAKALCFGSNNSIRVTGSASHFKVIEYDAAGNLISVITQNIGASVMNKIVFNQSRNFFFVSGTKGLKKIDSLGFVSTFDQNAYYDFVKGRDNFFYGLKSVSQSVVTAQYNSAGIVTWSQVKQTPGYTYTPFNFFQGVDNQLNVFVNYYYFSIIGLTYGSVYLKYDSLGNVIFNGPNPSGQMVKGIGNFFANSNYIASFKSYSGWASSIVVYKTRSNNSYIDTAYYDGIGNSRDEPNDIVCDNHGNIYLACRSWGVAVNYDFVILKFDPQLNLLWEYRYNGSQNSFDSAEKIKVDSSGNVYASGIISNNSDAINIYTVKLSAEGDLLWSDIFSRFNSSIDSNSVSDLQLDNSGNIYLCGKTKNSEDGKFGFLTVKYNTLTSINGKPFKISNYRLHKNFPNPFNPYTNISFDIPQISNVRINIFSVDGKFITRLADSKYPSGSHTIKWDASGLPSGVYYISMVSNNFSDIVKAIFLK